jgi:glucose/arabinose dehydrogenase
MMTGMYELPDAPGRWWVLEQQGRIMSLDPAHPDQSGVVLDLTSKVDSAGSELGLLGLAFAPDFATSGVFYLDYTAASPLRTVIARYTSPAPHTSAGATADTILEQAQPFENHNGGQMVFGPDGFLYISFGDGGDARDPMKNGQNVNVLLGKILRIDPSGASNGRAYKVPADNPFAGMPNTRDEIYSYGMRNPWRFSFDKATGDLWAGDVGQSAREEVDIIKKGGNYGWNVMEGTTCLTGGNNCDKSGKTLPIFEYPTTGENCAITGGFVYRGQAITALTGAYVYSDYCSGKVWALRYDGSKVTAQVQIAGMGTPLSSFAQDSTGELYALSYGNNGGIFKLTP